MNQKRNKFQKGHIPFNKGKKLEVYLPEKTIEKIKLTQFKKGERAGEKNNTWKGGIQHNTKDVIYLYDGVGERIRRPKKIYEEVNGPVPKGWIIYHVDGQMHNDCIDNLIAIPRAVLMKINAGRLNRNYHEINSAVREYLSESYKK
jgi:hypothetical protein